MTDTIFVSACAGFVAGFLVASVFAAKVLRRMLGYWPDKELRDELESGS